MKLIMDLGDTENAGGNALFNIANQLSLFHYLILVKWSK